MDAPPLSRRRRALFRGVLGLLLVVSLALGAEIVLRLAGLRTWNPRSFNVQVSPGNSLFRTDPVLATTELVRISRLSVMPLTAAHLARIEKLGG